jgi:hypothetical protein
MAYQSIYAGGGLAPKLKTPLNYVSPTPVAPKFNLNSVKDVPALNAALRAKQINQAQWMTRFKQIQPQQPKVNTGISALPGVVVEQDIAPIKNTLVGAVNKAKSQVKYLSGRSSTQQERDAIMKNQKGAASNPEYTKATQSIKPGTNSAVGLIQAQKMAAKGVKAPQIKSFLQKDAQALGAQTGEGLNTALLLGSISVPGEGILAKTVGPKLSAALGRDKATTALINTQKAAQATKAANLADKLGSPAVKEVNTKRIPVTEPTTTKIPVKGESTQVKGKVTANPDSKYIAASNKLTDQYEKDLARIQTVPHPVTQKVLQVQLDRKYQGLQADLDNTFGKTGVSFTGKATSAEPKLPRSALDSQTPAFEPRTSSATGVTEKTVPSTTATPKTATTTAAKPVEQATVTGDKVAGSALKSESRAVEAGLVKEFPDKATYTGTSYKQDAEDAVKLLHENPEEARAIASGYKSGKNQAFNVAVRRAVESKASKENDIDTIMRLGNSPAHTRTSEAAQTLGSEAYHADKNSPIQAVKEVSAARTTAKAKQLKQSPAKAIASTVKEIKSEPALKVSRQDWHSFVQDLRCK